MTRALLIATIAWGALCPAAAAQTSPPVASVYTTLDLKACKRVEKDPDGGRWSCKGLPGYDVLLAEGDLRQFIAFGPKAKAQRAATQTLGPFNSIFKGPTDRAVIEWRGEMQQGRLVPFATIIRYHIERNDGGGKRPLRSQVLVVSKVGPAGGTDACHVAYVDALSNQSANTMATEAADRMARGFDCRKEPSSVGAKGAFDLAPQHRI